MLDYKVLGTIMVFPTVLMALFLALKTHKTKEFFMNISVLCWISANSFWMCSEFYEWGKIKFWAILPFSLGMVFIVVFFVKNRKLL